jgi:hypothetical protein
MLALEEAKNDASSLPLAITASNRWKIDYAV